MLEFNFKLISPLQIKVLRDALNDKAMEFKFALAAQINGEDFSLTNPQEMEQELKAIKELLDRLPEE